MKQLRECFPAWCAIASLAIVLGSAYLLIHGSGGLSLRGLRDHLVQVDPKPEMMPFFRFRKRFEVHLRARLAQSRPTAQTEREGPARVALERLIKPVPLALSPESERQLASLDNADLGALLLDFYLDPQVDFDWMAIPPGAQRPDWVADCPGAIDRLLQAWQEGSEITQAHALRLLSACDDPRADAVLRQALTAKSSTLRSAAAQAIGWRRSPAQIPWLEACWERETEASVRRTLLKALAEIGHGRALPLFTAALEDADGEVRAAAVRGLGTLPDPGTVAMLEQVFWTDPSPGVRCEVLAALKKRGEQSALSLLLQAAHDGDPQVRACALQALGNLGVRDAAETLRLRLQDPDSDMRLAAVRGLARILGRESLPDLRRACEDQDFSVRCEALRQVERLGLTTPLGLEWVQVLGDPEAIVRLEALRILRKFPGPLPPEVLQAVRDVREYDDQPYLRNLAGRILESPGPTSPEEKQKRRDKGKNREALHPMR